MPHHGETLVDVPEAAVRILADRPELVLTDTRSQTEGGPNPHIHREQADGFLILDGELVFELGGERVVGDAGTFVLVPPGVVHSYRHEGTDEVRFLNFHAPGKDFADYLRGKKGWAETDTFEPPTGGGRPPTDAIVRAAGEGESLQLGPSSVLFRVGGDDGIGSLTVTDQTLAPGFPGPVPHTHEAIVDSFYVLEGTLTVRVGDELVELGPGEYLMAEPGTVHTFSNPTNTPVRALNAMAPGGFEQYLKEVAAAMVPGSPPDPAEMARVASKYDFHPA